MTDITVEQMPAFKRVYKKLPKQKQKIVNDAIRRIIKDPLVGEEKKGDLKGVFVYKFKIDQQETLLAYESSPQKILLLMLGVHENFYRNLKSKR